MERVLNVGTYGTTWRRDALGDAIHDTALRRVQGRLVELYRSVDQTRHHELALLERFDAIRALLSTSR